MEIFGALLIFLGIITGISTFITLVIEDSLETPGKYIILFIISLLLILVGCAIIREREPKEITPLDVYRGNTELQINYKIVSNDTITTDSIVIWTTKNYSN